jgi:two-component system phosphate regulon sensor histidine kinase PhoR
MAGRHAFASQLLKVTAALSAPAAIALIVFVVRGDLDLAEALLAAAACAAATGALLYRLFGDIAAINAYAEDMISTGRAVLPRLRHPHLLAETVAAVGRVRETWERRRRELERAATSTETVLQHLPDPLIMLSADGQVVRTTTEARKLLGADLGGDDLPALLRDPGIVGAVERVGRGADDEDVEISLHVPFERAFRARVVRLPRPTADGTAIVMALHDVTEIKRTEQTRVDFVANASHELRTPLAVLLGCAKTLRGAAKDDADAQARFLAMMESQAERMTRLVEDLLSLSRIELREHEAPRGRVDAERLVRHVADALQFPAEARGMRIDIAAEGAIPPVVGEESELAQLVQNLIDNAIKYGRENTAVDIRIAAAGGDAPVKLAGPAVGISVGDHGEGIPEHHIPRLTERFYRVDTGRSRELGGTGLGLAIVKHVLNRHRGALHVESELGRGSTFTVYLPAVPERGAAGARQPPAGEGAEGAAE